MFRKTPTSFRSIKALIAALAVCAANSAWLFPDAVAQTNDAALRASPCLETTHQLKPARRVMRASAALRLQAAMRDTVQRGTATGIADALAGTGWRVGGKTGSGPALLPKGPQLDGWFAGLVFDPQGKARFTVATFVRSGGRGGENAARISAELARYLIGGKPGLSQ